MNCLSCFIFISVQFRTHFAEARAGAGRACWRVTGQGERGRCRRVCTFSISFFAVVVLLFRVQRDDNGACRPTDVSNKVSRIKDNRGN